MTRYTPEQTEFIHHGAGNALCIAGAGTGKTTTLVGLIGQKLQQLPAQEMLVLMFNRDIRGDFQEKLRSSGINQPVSVHTFHSFCLKFLNQSGFFRETGFRVDFQSGESDKSLVKLILREFSGKETTYTRQQMIKDPKTIELLLSFIGLVKAYMLPPYEVFKLADINRDYLFIIDCYEEFERRRKELKLLFFDDWLVESVKLLESNEAIRARLHQRCKLIVVDEFQDINTAQYRLLKQLLGPQAQILAVGDVDQCIYKWRGSAPQFMLNFEQDFAPATVYTLSQTFRFGHSLALAASHLIANNKQRFSDFITTATPESRDTKVVGCGSSRQVGEILQSVKDYIDQGGNPSEIAILVRRWSQTLLFELAFLSKQLPYHMPVPSVLAHSKEVSMLMALMSWATGGYDEADSGKRSVMLFNFNSYPHCYVPNKTLKPLCEQLAGMEPGQWLTFIRRYEKANPSLKLETFVERLDLLLRLKKKGSFKAHEVFRQYRNESGLDSWIWKTEATASEIEEAIERLDSVETVLDNMDQNCKQALQYFEYYTYQSGVHSAQQDDTQRQNGVQLTTIFLAKGCEYEHVHLPFWDKDAFPYIRMGGNSVGADIEEERRLAYVALTRAKRQAVIYHTEPERPAGKATNASRFVAETKLAIAAELGPALYQVGDLPSYSSPVAEAYCRHLGREGDIKIDERSPLAKKTRVDKGERKSAKRGVGQTGDEPDEYSYQWALRQPLPENGLKVVQAMTRSKTAKYLDGEISRILRELKTADKAKQSVLVNRLIATSYARSQVRR
ncbi:helicase UvrD [Photobacterium aquae]|uniref:DNA 3'-5' helicase n=1 Tax=Photobacterium aquae TaxID=1195763 RepID=A0A0J1HAZ0_9GAMM|nr:ATP-dependent helicase [Photobacterium aquae]KLV08815.1 helicase UvrD [Photobacterium aquae]